MSSGSRRRSELGPDDGGRTLAAIVRELMDGLPWTKAKKAVAAGKVLVDGRVRRDPAERIEAGAVVEVDLHAPPRPVESKDVPNEVPILHLDPSVVVVDKPAGLLSVPWEDETDTLLHRAHAAVQRRSPGARRLPPLRVVQRLDKDTSGVLVFARTKTAERSLGDQLRRHSVDRRYLALVVGEPLPGTIDTFILADRGDGRRGSARMRPGDRGAPPPGAKRSITHVEVLESFSLSQGGIVSLVSCRLSTGRQHQIRIHLAESGHPLLGERVYGSRDLAPPLTAARPMLHAERLGFQHPTEDRSMLFRADPPHDFQQLLARLRAG